MLIYSLWFSLIWIGVFTLVAIYSMYRDIGDKADNTINTNFWIILLNVPLVAILGELILLGGIHVK